MRRIQGLRSDISWATLWKVLYSLEVMVIHGYMHACNVNSGQRGEGNVIKVYKVTVSNQHSFNAPWKCV